MKNYGYMKWHSEMNINQTYELDYNEILRLHIVGLHYCRLPGNVLVYFHNDEDKYAKIEILGDCVHSLSMDVSVTDKIKVVELLNEQNIMKICGNNTWNLINGVKVSYLNGKLHSYNDQPIILKQFNYRWYKNGLLHRLNGPALEFRTGEVEYWIDGVLQENN